MKKRIKFISVFMLIVTLSSCLNTEFDDKTFYTLDEAVKSTPDYSLKVTTGSVQSVMFSIHSLYGVHLMCLADQISSTNRFEEFWDWAQEPRKRINNTTSYGAYEVTRDWFQDLYNANLNANIVIDLVENKNLPALDANGEDRTKDVLAAIYFVKAVSQGYLGLLYDRGIVVNSLSGTPQFADSYVELIESSLNAFDKAIALAEGNPDLVFDFMGPSIPISRADFIKLLHSYAARVAAGLPRSEAEATALGSAHWDRVIGYANKGFNADFLLPADPNVWWNNTMDWSQSILTDGAGYLPVDIKVAWLVNNTHPQYYPSGDVVLDQVTSDDDRFYDYFAYTPNFGFLRADRNRGLFTNYFRTRWDNPANTMSNAGILNPVVLKDEMTLLKADAEYFKGNYAASAALLNGANTNRTLLSGLAPVGATRDEVEYALHREYAIEIDNTGGVGSVWIFMRRHDLLIGGTPTQLPLPQEQLQIVGEDLYTFGGSSYFDEKGKFDEVGTAANNGWKLSQ